MSLFSLFKKKYIVVVHDGKFHCDDIFAVATLRLVLGDTIRVVRTRDVAQIARADFVADVGGVYDLTINRFDHHQKGGAGTHANGIPYASFGLVWKKFGETLCGSKIVADTIEENLVCAIDADDNGVALASFIGNAEPRSLQSFFYAYRPSWKEDHKMYDENFLQMVDVAVSFLEREIIKTKDLLEASVAVAMAYQKAQDKRIIILETNYPYNDELQKYPEPMFVVSLRPNGSWGVNTISLDHKNHFALRKQLPESWAGLRDGDMAKISGVSDAIFCHNGRFLAVAKSKEGALALAHKALEN